jgi:hypothetical protein
MAKPGHFDIVVDAPTGTLTATLVGHWDVATVKAYCDQLGRAAQEVCANSKPKWLVDLSEFDVQPQDVAAYMGRAIAELTARLHASVAVVAPRALVGMQSRRIAQRPDHRSFATAIEAKAWLEQLG